MRSPWSSIFLGLAWLYLLGIGVQFLLGGMGVLGGESMDAHEGLGYAVLHLAPILMLILAFVAKVPRDILMLTGALLVVMLPLPIWAAEFQGEFLGSLHVLSAFFVAILSYEVAHRMSRAQRGEARI